MNREIKFRAWSESFREYTMFYDVEMIIKEDGVWWVCNNKTRIFQLTSRTHKLMQFTGLHDKNGKEIYEGDVLHDIGGKIWVVKWNHSGWYKWISNPNEEGGVMFHIHEQFNNYKVIGNIYENPELCS